jgi:triphosphoribosyl-dephospho-CoA synthetase
MAIKKEVSLIDVTDLAQVKHFTEGAIEKHLSFGGSADLLIATLFIYYFTQRYF